MIRHIVLTKFKPDVSEAKIAQIYSQLSDLTKELTGTGGFVAGRSQSPEKIERGYRHGFVIDFESWDDLSTYSNHKKHQAIGSQIIDNAVGGIDGVLVVDIEV